jgi:tetratricopeptide (TPR) repeat protein
MLYEMVDYVNEQTAFSAEMRAGGTQQVLKRLIAAGYPVLVEKGPFIEFAGKVSWMGHYALLTAYDDAKGEFLSQDSYYSADYPIPYATLDDEWRAFNYLFMVIYPPDQRDQVLSLLGELADPTASYQIALERARAEATALTGLQGFFAQFNIGTSLTSLQDFPGAAAAFDQAFLLLPQLPAAQRPWRMMWYQTGPYFAYYFTGRYQDVINLADNTLNNISEPYLEESFVWRARARIALGDTQAAIADVEKALEYHPGFVPAVDLARQLGISG